MAFPWQPGIIKTSEIHSCRTALLKTGRRKRLKYTYDSQSRVDEFHILLLRSVVYWPLMLYVCRRLMNFNKELYCQKCLKIQFFFFFFNNIKWVLDNKNRPESISIINKISYLSSMLIMIFHEKIPRIYN